MKKSGFIARVLGVFLALVVLLSSFNITLYANKVERFYTYYGTVSNAQNVSWFSLNKTSANITITDTYEEKWIDRLANKPDYAVRFYEWLENNSGKNGSLVTAKDVTLNSGESVHVVESITDEVEFSFPVGTSENDIWSFAEKACTPYWNKNSEKVSEWIIAVYSAFVQDRPDVFWLSGLISSMYSVDVSISYYPNKGIGTVTYTQDILLNLQSNGFDIRSSNYSTAYSIQTAITNRDYYVNNIVRACKYYTDYEKIVYFNNYLTKNNYYNLNYNTASSVAHQCMSALSGTMGADAPVCEGYAKAFKVLCDKMGIPCVLVDGVCDELHMWNNVYLDGKWYVVDVTFNDPFTGRATKLSGYESEDYLLVGSDNVIDGEIFSKSHITTNVITEGGVAFMNEPIVSKTSYRATLPHKCTFINGYCSYCFSEPFDANRDLKIDILDLLSIKTALIEYNSIGNFDCNFDGLVNSLDIVEFKKFIFEIS